MSNADDILKSKTKKVFKHNKLNKANFANYNLNDYRVYLNAITLIGGVTARGKYAQPAELTREYRLAAKEFSEQFNINRANSYGILKAAAVKLMTASIKVEKPELKQSCHINVCEVVKYNESEGTIDIMFTGSIMEYLKQRAKGGNFTVYNLKEIADLTSIYAVRLYEMMQQFNTTTGMVVRTIEQWREIFGLSPGQYPFYANLKQKVFMQALTEINAKTGYKLTMVEEKEGRKVARVRFNFIPDQVHSGVDYHTGEMRTRHIKPTTKLTSQKQIKKSTPKIPAVHSNQQELPLNEALSQVQLIHQLAHYPQAMQPDTQLESAAPETDAQSQKEESLAVYPAQPALSNPPPQKKKRFFGLF